MGRKKEEKERELAASKLQQHWHSIIIDMRLCCWGEMERGVGAPLGVRSQHASLSK